MWSRELFVGRQFKKTTVSAVEIQKIIRAGLSERARETKVRKKESFAPSSIGYGNAKCPRYWYMAFEGKYVFEESSDEMALANMDNGTYVHDRLERVFKDSGSLVAAESELIMKDPPIRGYIDLLARVESGEIVVIEVKSAKDEIFSARVNTMKALDYHMYQILIYLKGTGKKSGAILYENKNDQTICIIPVEMTEENERIIDEALDWMRKVHKNWQDGPDGKNMPKRPYTKSKKECMYCPLKKECYENVPNGEVVIEPMEVAKF